MTTERETPDPSEEPIGIVISRGRTAERPPRFSAYVWATAEEEDEEAKGLEVGAA